jgi:hypothetical protein
MAEAGDSVPRIPGHHRRLLEAWLSAFPEGWYSIPKPSGNNVADYVRSEMLVNGITDFLVAERGLLVCVSIVKVVWPSGSFIGKLDWCGMSFDEALKRAATAWKLWPVDVEADAIRVFRDHCLVRRNTNVDSVQNTTIEKLNAGEFMCHPPDFIRFTECDRANEEAAIRRAVENNPPFVGENKTAVVEPEAAVETDETQDDKNPGRQFAPKDSDPPENFKWGPLEGSAAALAKAISGRKNERKNYLIQRHPERLFVRDLTERRFHVFFRTAKEFNEAKQRFDNEQRQLTTPKNT